MREVMLSMAAMVMLLIVTCSGWRYIHDRARNRTDLAGLIWLAKMLTWVLVTLAVGRLLDLKTDMALAPFAAALCWINALPGKRWRFMTRLDRVLMATAVAGLVPVAVYVALPFLEFAGYLNERNGRYFGIVSGVVVPMTMVCGLAVLGWTLYRELQKKSPSGIEAVAGRGSKSVGTTADGADPASRPTLLGGLAATQLSRARRGIAETASIPAFDAIGFAALFVSGVLLILVTASQPESSVGWERCVRIEALLFLLVIQFSAPARVSVE